MSSLSSSVENEVACRSPVLDVLGLIDLVVAVLVESLVTGMVRDSLVSFFAPQESPKLAEKAVWLRLEAELLRRRAKLLVGKLELTGLLGLLLVRL